MEGQPRSTVRRPLTALLAGLAVGLTVAIVLLAAVAGSVPDRVASSASPSASSPAASRSPTPAPSAVLARRIAEVEAQVPLIRGLRPTAEVPTRVIDRDRFKTELRALFAQEGLAEQYQTVGDLYEHLGLLPADTDLEKLVLEVSGAGVIGVYIPEKKEMIVVESGAGLDPTGRMTLAHEFTHALQDQHFGLDELDIEDPTQSDRGLARLALVEGDATQLMIEWATAHLSPLELLSVVTGSLTPEQQQVLDEMPPAVARQMLFPYVEGQLFVADLKQRGGWRAVDSAYDDPPDSTEQILHPQAFAVRERPVAVRLPDLEAALGPGWSNVLEDTMGELSSQVWLDLATPSADPEATPSALRAAAGWGGDRIASYEGPDGGWAVAWQTAWDSAADAAEFRTAAGAVLRRLRAGSALLGEGGDTVIVLFASDAATLDRLRGPFESL
jgi:hypothetical protein